MYCTLILLPHNLRVALRGGLIIPNPKSGYQDLAQNMNWFNRMVDPVKIPKTGVTT